MVVWWSFNPIRHQSTTTRRSPWSSLLPISAERPSRAVRNQFDQQTGLPFLEVLSASEVESACRAWNHRWRNRIYTPWITLSMFLSQILSSDQSCGDALERFQKYRKDCGLPPVADDTASYCEARQRLPEEVVWDLARRAGQAIHQKADADWLFHGRPVKLLDGTTVIMPDTEANQAEYPQSRSQKPGLGFPIAHILLIISLAVGTVLEAAMGPYQGKQSSELGLFRQISGQLQPGDIALADRFFCNYWVIADSQRRGVDVVFRLHQTRKTDFRRGRRLGPDDHIVTWPKSQRPDWMSPAEYAAMPTGIETPRDPCPDQGSQEADPRTGDRNDALGCDEIFSIRIRRFVQATMACRTGYKIDQDHDANGDASDQDVRRWCAKRSGCICWPIT